ncbi:MAG TPA: Coq4 family protein [Polyangiaceae bacterium]|jgi:ubiquinone biosynthesis protein Coq4
MQALGAVRERIAFAKTLWSFVDLVKHPDHLDRVFEISDGMTRKRTEVLAVMAQHFARDPVGAEALRERPRLHVDLDALAQLPAGTLGRVFADHMRANGLDPASIPTLPGTHETEFVRAHLYETHDVWHAVTGFRADVAGELGLQAFYAAQAPGGLPWMLLAMGFLNTALYAMGEREARFEAISRGWEMGRRARPLFGVRWDTLWSTSLDEVRLSLGVEPYRAPAALAA